MVLRLLRGAGFCGQFRAKPRVLSGRKVNVSFMANLLDQRAENPIGSFLVTGVLFEAKSATGSNEARGDLTVETMEKWWEMVGKIIIGRLKLRMATPNLTLTFQGCAEVGMTVGQSV
jgi:hypothetical protein